MARGVGNDSSKALVAPFKGAPNRFLLAGIDDVTFEEIQEYLGEVPDAGSEEHRRRLEAYLRGRCGRAIVLEVGPNDPEGFFEQGGSFTDMKDFIRVANNIPEGSTDPGEIATVMAGITRHEACHLDYTDPEVFKKFCDELAEIGRTRGMVTKKHIHRLWNTLEDGMIERRELDENRGSYLYIAASNALHDRTGATPREIKKEIQFPVEAGYVPEDANGKPLAIVDGKAVVPPGTMMSMFGKKPVSKETQISAALLSEALPGHEVGELHPDVQAAFDECQPFVEAAVHGNTADCAANALKIRAILEKHDLAPDETMDPETQEAIKQLIQQAIQSGQIGSAPQVQPGGEGNDSEASEGAQNPTPDVDGAIEVSPDMADALGGSGSKDDGGAGSDSGDDKAGGGSDDDPGADEGGKSDEANSKGDEKKNDSKGDDSENKKNGNSGKEGRDSGGEQSKQDSKSKSDQGGEDGDGHTGEKISDKEFEQILQKEREDLRSSRRNEHESRTRAAKNGMPTAESWKMPPGQAITTQRQMAQHATAEVTDDSTHLLGKRLGVQLKKLRGAAKAPKTRIKRGNLDSRRFSSAMAGNQYVFKRPGATKDVSIEIDVSIDRSGSVTCSDVDNNGQYRMAKMFAHAAKATKIPTSIYGWTSGYGRNTEHFAYKEKTSDSLTGVEGFFGTGGGGTPTDDGIEFSRARLSKSRAEHKVMVVVTDGAANDVDSAAKQVAAAQKEGITVVGLAFGCSDASMNSQFGPGNWVSISDYSHAPDIVGKLIRDIATDYANKH